MSKTIFAVIIVVVNLVAMTVLDMYQKHVFKIHEITQVSVWQIYTGGSDVSDDSFDDAVDAPLERC